MKYRAKHLWLVGRARLRDRRSQSRNKLITQFSTRSPFFRSWVALFESRGEKMERSFRVSLVFAIWTALSADALILTCYLHLQLVISSRYRIDAVIALIVLAQLVQFRCNSLELTAAASTTSLDICFRANAWRNKLYFIVYFSYFARNENKLCKRQIIEICVFYVFIAFCLKNRDGSPE